MLNQISSIEPKWFDGLDNLELSLSGNQLSWKSIQDLNHFKRLNNII